MATTMLVPIYWGGLGKVFEMYRLTMAVVVYFTMARMINMTEHNILHSYYEFLRPLVREDVVKSIQGGLTKRAIN